jgi:parvulin-like peptidyl-prolyl isomerase
MARPKFFVLLVLGALLLSLFLGFAIVQGIGDPDIPSGAVAVVEDAPDDLGTITGDQLEHAVELAAAAGRVEPVPKPGDEKYEVLAKAALGELLDTIWIQGQAAEMGISVTPEEVAAKLKAFKQQAVHTPQQYREFLKEAHYNQADFEQYIKRQILSTKIQDQLKEEASEPSSSEIEDYYEAAKSSQYATQSLEEAKPLISSQLSERSEQQNLADFIRSYSTKWESRTFCAPEVTIERCANFKGDGRPEGALPACYEGDPEEPAKECPAPVAQIKPALPGSVSLLAPQGTQRAQRPHPPGDESTPQASSEVLGAPSPVE